MGAEEPSTAAPEPSPAPERDAEQAAASRRWRALWRTHFYAGVFSAPVLLMFAVTGLVILYTQPFWSVTQGHLRNVSDRGDMVSLDDQKAAVTKALPDATISFVVVPRNATSSTEFGLDDGHSAFVDPYTATYLGTTNPGGGIVGLSNRLHGFLNNESVTVKLPSIAGPLSDGPWMQEFVVGDMILEVFACWSIVLVASGLYLWWPRRSRAAGGRAERALLVPRLGKKGRARWRDLHAIPGMLFALGSLFVLTTGLFWSSYWAAGYSAVAEKITPGTYNDPPTSSIAKKGDIDRFNKKINWNTGDTPIPNSDGSKVDPSDLPAPISLDTAARAAREEHMKPGYWIVFPENGKDDAGNPAYGSFTLSNSWPRKTSEAKDVFIDQFSGKTLGVTRIYGYGGMSVVSDTMVSTHMGTQLGIVSRILMTGICLAIIWSVISAVVMYTKRRRKGSLGLPRRPVDVHLARGLIALMVVLGIVYPLWGVSAIIVLAFDRFVVRQVAPLRRAFGQR